MNWPVFLIVVAGIFSTLNVCGALLDKNYHAMMGWSLVAMWIFIYILDKYL